MRIYAIGDIHGHLDKLRDVHRLIDEDNARHGGDHIVIHLGDLVDRGPDSVGVIEFLMAGQKDGMPWVILKGNHDRMMSMFLMDKPVADPHLREGYSWMHPGLGGKATLASYGVDADTGDEMDIHERARAAVPERHREFLAELELVYEAPGCLFVHAGIRPGIKMSDQVENDLVWIRDPFLTDTRDHGSLILHGHTPIEEVTHFGNRVALDTGAAFGGELSAVVVEAGEVWQVVPGGRRSLRP